MSEITNTSGKKGNTKLHYAWIVCLACTFTMFSNNGITESMFSVYLPFIMEKFGISNTQVSVVLTLKAVVSLVTVMLSGYYYRVFSARVGILLATFMCGGSFVLFGFADSFPMFLIGSVILGVGTGLGTSIPISMVLRLWFAKKRKLAMSITTLAGSLGYLLGLPSLVTHMIQTVGLQKAFNMNAALVFIFMLAAFILMRNDPVLMGLEAYGSNSADDGEAEEQKKVRPRGRLEKSDWIFLAPPCITVGIIGCTTYNYLSVYLTSEGVSPATIALLFTVTGGAVAAGKFGFGWLSDQFSTYGCNRLYFGALAGGILIMTLFVNNTPLLYLAIIIMGFGSPLASVGFVSWGWDLTSAEQSDDAIRIMQICLYIGMVGFNFLPGVIADACGGSYKPVFFFYVLLAVPAFLSIQHLYRLNRKRAEAAAQG